MDLVRDILDSLLLDKNGRPIGRVDGIVIDVRENRPPRVAALAVGAERLAHRIHPRFGRWFRAPVWIPLQAIREIGVDLELDVDAQQDPDLLRSDKWLATHILARIPGGKK